MIKVGRYEVRLWLGSVALTAAVNVSYSHCDERILATLSQTLSWSHFVELLPIKDPLAHDFYAEMCHIERRDVRTLRAKINSMLYFTALPLLRARLHQAIEHAGEQAARRLSDAETGE